MRVLQIIDGLGTGGAEKLITDTVPLFVNQGIEVDVLLLNGEVTPFYKKLKDLDVCTIYSLGNSFYNPIYIFKMIPFIKKYDVVHVHLFPAQYFSVLAKILSFTNVRLIFTEHSTGNSRINNPKLRGIEKWIYSHYRKIVCITDEVREVLLKKLQIEDERLLVIENGINIEEISQQVPSNRSSFGYNINDKLLIMVAGFREQKDHDTLITTLTELPNEYKLILVGDGERRFLLQNLVTQYGLSDRVNFLGVRTDVYSLIKMADIAVLSSHWEGFGLAAAEAMACGIPTVASNVAGLAQVIEGGGILFEKGNVSDLRAKILSLENADTYKEVGCNGVRKANQYDINVMVRKTIDLYKSL